jgi:transposase-like protein
MEKWDSDYTPEQLRAYFDGRGDAATNRAISEALGDNSTRLGRWLIQLQDRMRKSGPRLGSERDGRSGSQ